MLIVMTNRQTTLLCVYGQAAFSCCTQQIHMHWASCCTNLPLLPCFCLLFTIRLHLRCDYFLKLSGKITRISLCSVVYAVVHNDMHINVGSLNSHVSQFGISFFVYFYQVIHFFVYLCLSSNNFGFCHLILFSFS